MLVVGPIARLGGVVYAHLASLGSAAGSVFAGGKAGPPQPPTLGTTL